jgi:MerR family transcriptional regulator, light-induced transcriptional regulator
VAHADQTFSPRELARAIGVSESSVKRWVDAGDLPAAKTSGGHRRIALTDAVAFIRKRRLPVRDASILGLAEVACVDPAEAQDPISGDRLVQMVVNGVAPQVRGLLVAAYLRGDPLAELCDGPVRDALHHVGTLWTQNRRGIYVEHRAVDLFAQAFQEIRSLIPAGRNGSPVAVGGALAGDPYQMPSLMAASVLADVGYEVVHLGPDTPPDVLADAALEQRARLVWLSVSAAPDDAAIAAAASHLAARLAPAGAHVVVGGRRTEGLELPELSGLHHEVDMTGLERVARLALENGRG